MTRTLWKWAAPVAVLATVAVWGWAQERKPTPREEPATQELPPTADNAPANDPPFLTPKPIGASRVVEVMDSSGKRHRMYVPKDTPIGATLSVQEGSDAKQVYTVVADPDAPKEFTFSRSAVSSMGGDAVYPGVVEPGLPGTSIYNPGIPRQNVNSTIAIGPPMKQKTRSRSVTETYLEPFTNDEIVEIKATQEAMTTLRSDKPENEKATAKRQLAEIMNKGFERDLDSREKEVAELEARVKKLREQLEKRKAAKDKIIELRLTQIEFEADGLGFPGLPLSLPNAGAGLTPTPDEDGTYGPYAPYPNALPKVNSTPSFDPNDNAPAYYPGSGTADPAGFPVPTRSDSNREPDEFRPTSPIPTNNIPTDDGLPPEGESPRKPSPPIDGDSNTDSNAPAGTAPAATSSVTSGRLPAEAPGVSQPSRNLLLNSTFEDGPSQWSSGKTPPTVEYTIDPTGGVKETKAAKIKKTEDRYFPISEWTQRIAYDGSSPVVEVSAMVKTKDVRKAILDVAFLDANEEWIKHEWVAYIGEQNDDPQPLTHDFKEYKGAVRIPPKTTAIIIGLQDYGPGEIWFDDVKANFTDLMPKEPNNVPSVTEVLGQ